jgi:cation transport ATPase
MDDKKLHKNNKLSYLLIFVFIILAIFNFYLFFLRLILSIFIEIGDLIWLNMIIIIIIHFIFMLPVLPQKKLRRKVFYAETAIVIISFIIYTASCIDIYFSYK